MRKKSSQKGLRGRKSDSHRGLVQNPSGPTNIVADVCKKSDVRVIWYSFWSPLFCTRVRTRARFSTTIRKRTIFTAEVLKKIDIYKTADKLMVHFLNTSWTGARFCLKRSIFKTRFWFLPHTCDKSRKNAKTIVFIAPNASKGYPQIGMSRFPENGRASMPKWKFL